MRKKQKLESREGQTCVVDGCTSNLGNIENVRFFVFPKHNAVLFRKWKAATGQINYNPDVPKYVCSRHFDTEDFTDLSTKTLKPAAVPLYYAVHDEHRIKDNPIGEYEVEVDAEMTENERIENEMLENGTEHFQISTDGDHVIPAHTETNSIVVDDEDDVEIVEKPVEMIEVDDSEEETDDEKPNVISGPSWHIERLPVAEVVKPKISNIQTKANEIMKSVEQGTSRMTRQKSSTVSKPVKPTTLKPSVSVQFIPQKLSEPVANIIAKKKSSAVGMQNTPLEAGMKSALNFFKLALSSLDKLSEDLNLMQASAPSIVSLAEGAVPTYSRPFTSVSVKHFNTLYKLNCDILKWRNSCLLFQKALYHICNQIVFISQSVSPAARVPKDERAKNFLALVEQTKKLSAGMKKIWVSEENIVAFEACINDAMDQENRTKIGGVIEAMKTFHTHLKILHKTIEWLMMKVCCLNNDAIEMYEDLQETGILRPVKVSKKVDADQFCELHIVEILKTDEEMSRVKSNGAPKPATIRIPPVLRNTPNPPASMKRKVPEPKYQNTKRVTIIPKIPTIIFLEKNIKFPPKLYLKLKEYKSVPKTILTKRGKHFRTMFVHTCEVQMGKQDSFQYRVVSEKSEDPFIRNYLGTAQGVHEKVKREIRENNCSLERINKMTLVRVHPDNDPEYEVVGYGVDEKKQPLDVPLSVCYSRIQVLNESSITGDLPSLEEHESVAENLAEDEEDLSYRVNDDGTAVIVQPDGSLRTLEPGEVVNFDCETQEENEEEYYEYVVMGDEQN